MSLEEEPVQLQLCLLGIFPGQEGELVPLLADNLQLEIMVLGSLDNWVRRCWAEWIGLWRWWPVEKSGVKGSKGNFLTPEGGPL